MGCTECCRQKGFVYLTEADILKAAAFLKLDVRRLMPVVPSGPVWQTAELQDLARLREAILMADTAIVSH